MTAVKLIINVASIRMTMRKRLSDGMFLEAKVGFKLEQLLWVLTVSQIETSFVFVKSLQNSIARSVAQSQQIAKTKIQKMAPSSSTIVGSDSPRKTSVSNHNSSSGFSHLFRVHDVIETSYLVCIAKMELHFCEEGCIG